jgi:hypothetical protein
MLATAPLVLAHPHFFDLAAVGRALRDHSLEHLCGIDEVAARRTLNVAESGISMASRNWCSVGAGPWIVTELNTCNRCSPPGT